MNFVHAAKQIVDIITKPITSKLFLPFRRKLGVFSVSELCAPNFQLNRAANTDVSTVDSSSELNDE